MNLHPFIEVASAMKRKMDEGYVVHQQFVCSGCGIKQTMSQPNTAFTEGKCEECGHITDIVKDGCNFLLIASHGL